MAKIVYFKSPITKEFCQIDRSGVSLLSVIKELEIENESLSIQINGDVPVDVDATIILKEDDSIIIKKVVHGNDAGQKRTLGTIIQLAAIAGSIAVGGLDGGSFYAAAIAVSGALVSGALMANAAKLEAAGLLSQQAPEIDTSTNSYSLTNVSNQVRPLQPVPIVIGSHRVIPDFYAKPFKSVYSEDNTIGEFAPDVVLENSGISAINGAVSTNSSWINVPAGFVEDHGSSYGAQYDRFPQYDIKISPMFFGVTRGNLTPEIESECKTIFKNIITSMWAAASGSDNHSSHINFNFLDPSICALPIYHSDSSDPYYSRPNGARYNILWTIIRAYELNRKRVTNGSIIPTDYNYYSDVNNFFNGTYDYYTVGMNNYSYEQRFFRSGNDIFGSSDVTVSTSIPKGLVKSGSVAGYYYPNSITTSAAISSAMIAISQLLEILNGFSSLPNVGVFSWSIEYHSVVYGITSVKEEGVEYSTQVFNYGIGDLEISDRKIGSTDAGASDSISYYSPIDKSSWKIPDFIHPEIAFPVKFYSKIFVGDEKKLSNISDVNHPVSIFDNDQHNFIFYEGALGQPLMFISISGVIYGTSTSTGFASNSCSIEIHWKRKSEEFWRKLGSYGLFTIQNDNPKKINFKTSVGSDAEDFLNENDRLMVRIRKIDLDSDNNTTNKVCDLYVKRVNAVSVDERDIDLESMHRPMNLEGLFMTSLLSDAAQTNKYSAMIDSKCWYYNFETSSWVWGKTRNPAWWFLFYAHGGFETDDDSDIGSRVYPLSPTNGWVNYPGYAHSTNHMFGSGLSDSEIDIEQIKLWAEFCDDRELKIDLILKDDTSCADVLERIANVGRASVTYYNSKLSVVYEDPETPVSCIFGMGNIKAGSFSVEYVVADPIRKVVANYVDREDWETKQVEAIVPFSTEENLKVVEITLEGVTETQQAQRECNIMAARQFFQRRSYTWEVDIEGKLIKRGDVISLSHDSTQYGISGRIIGFIYENGFVTGIKTTAILNESAEYITIRNPRGDLNTYEIRVENDTILFDEEYPLENAPFYISNDEINKKSIFKDSIPEDFTFVASEKETPGKIVRVASIESIDDMSFKITAVDEDPAMWAYEYDSVDEPQSFSDSEVELVVENCWAEYLPGGKVKILWSGKNADLVQIINLDNNLPVEGDGSYTFSNGEAIIELTKNHKFNLEVRPFAIGTPFRSVSKRVFAWPQ